MNQPVGEPPGIPELAMRDRRLYFAFLRSQGYPVQVAADMTDKKFGQISLPSDGNKQQQRNQFAQVGGMVAGAAGSALAIEGGRRAYNAMFPKEPTATPTDVSQPTQPTQQPIAPVEQALPSPGAAATNVGQTGDVGASSLFTGNNVIAPDAAVPQGFTPVGTSESGGVIIAPTAAVEQGVPPDTSFLESVDWGKLPMAGLTALQAYNAYNAYKRGDKLGAALSGAGALASGTALAANAAGMSSTASAAGAAAAPIAGLAGAYQGYQTAKYISDAPRSAQRTRMGTLGMAGAGAGIGASIGSVVPGPGTAIGAAIGAGVGALTGLAATHFGSSKEKYQMIRDKARDSLVANNIIDKDYKGTLADGSSYDFGKDGKKYGKLNTDDPNWGMAAGLANVIAAGEGMYGRPLEAVATMYANAAMSNSKGDPNIIKQNMLHFAQQRGFTPENIKQQIGQMEQEGLLKPELAAAYTNGVNELFGAQQQQQVAPRPGKGEVGRISPGMYRDDKGRIVRASSTREALERAYSQPSRKKGKK